MTGLGSVVPSNRHETTTTRSHSTLAFPVKKTFPVFEMSKMIASGPVETRVAPPRDDTAIDGFDVRVTRSAVASELTVPSPAMVYEARTVTAPRAPSNVGGTMLNMYHSVAPGF